MYNIEYTDIQYNIDIEIYRNKDKIIYTIQCM